MLYSIIGSDVPDSLELRAATRPRHLEYWQPLMDAGRVIVAGPNPAIDSPEPGPAGMVGTLIVAEFESLQAARDWMSSDPYVVDGVFENVTIHPFIQVHP
jgi:uncharacterized protein YciI